MSKYARVSIYSSGGALGASVVTLLMGMWWLGPDLARWGESEGRWVGVLGTIAGVAGAVAGMLVAGRCSLKAPGARASG